MKKLLGILFLILLISGNAYPDVATNILKLKSLNACESCDLVGADLKGANLGGADLTDANLTDAHLREANLTDANLSGADLRGALLDKATLCNTITPWGTDNSGC